MVLSSSTADPAAGQDWLSRIGRALRLAGRNSVMVLVTNQSPAQLRSLVIALRGIAAETGDALCVCLHASDLLEAPAGAVVVLQANPLEADWLNMNRPLVAERRLRVVLWARQSAASALKRFAPDFFDWISHIVECPAAVPAFALAGVRQAPAYPGLVWLGDRFEEIFAIAYPGEAIERVTMDSFLGEGGYERLLDAMLETKGWLAIARVGALSALVRIRWAMAESGRKGRVVIEQPDCEAPGWWPVSDRTLEWSEAADKLGAMAQPALVAALLDLEPGAIKLAAEMMAQGMWDHACIDELARVTDPGVELARRARGLFDVECVACRDAPPCVLRGLSDDAAVQVQREAVCARVNEVLRAFHGGVDSIATSLRRDELATWANAAPILLPRRRWPPMEHCAYAVETAIRGSEQGEESPWSACVLMAMDAGHIDIAAYWALHHRIDALVRAAALYSPGSDMARANTDQVNTEEVKTLLEPIFRKLEREPESIDHSECSALFILVDIHRRDREYVEAETLLGRILGIPQIGRSEQYQSRLALADVLCAQGRHNESEKLLGEILHELDPVNVIDEAVRGETLYSLASAARERGAYEEAATFGRQALSLLRHTYGPEHPVCIGAALEFGNTLLAQGKVKEAELKFHDAVDITYHGYREISPLLSIARSGWGLSLAKQGHYVKAINLLHEIKPQADINVTWYRERALLALTDELRHCVSDTELLNAWRAGDGRAGDLLVKRYYGNIRRFFLNKVPPGDIEDLIQSTFIGCAKGVSAFRGTFPFRTYLFQIARNILMDYMKHRRHESLDLDSISVADMDPSPLSIMARRQQENMLVQALRRIPIDDQMVLELYYWENLTAAEIGEVVGLSEGAVRSRIHRAKDELRRSLENQARSPQELSDDLDALEQWAEEIHKRDTSDT